MSVLELPSVDTIFLVEVKENVEGDIIENLVGS